MTLTTEMSPDEMRVFFEEVEENIQCLDEDIIRLEKYGTSPDLLQRIFRAAHTLKGSSSMVGYQEMADLTHAMENLLDKLRFGQLSPTDTVVNALLSSLDLLKVLKRRLLRPETQIPDISQVIEELKNAAVDEKESSPCFPKPLKLDSQAFEKCRASIESDRRPVHIIVSVKPDCAWCQVRLFQSFSEASRLGEVVVSCPTFQEIEQGQIGHCLEMIILSRETPDYISARLSAIDDVAKVEVKNWQPESSTSCGVSSSIPTNSGGMAIENSGQPDKAVPRNSQSDIADMSESMQTVRIDVRVLDSLMNIVEELVVDRSRISQVSRMLANRYGDDDLISDLGLTSNHIVKIINELHQNIMLVRMVPISVLFNKMPRLVRDLTQKQGKKADFEVSGGETELDRTIIEQIRDPIIHLLRNAIDHGIETPELRVAAGKPETAMLRLCAYQEQGHIVITVEDDGRGIDPEKVKAAAIRKGLIAEEVAKTMSDAEAIDLIWRSGISTAAQVTEISGRGVGLDIVRTNIERLNGSVSVDTRPGAGTIFTLKLPITVAVFQGLMVSSAGITYVIPIVSVLETLRIGRDELKTVLGHGCFRLRDRLIPVIRMSTVLGLHQQDSTTEYQYVIVVKVADREVGIIVDALMDQQEFVIKPLGKYLGEVKGIAGATILGDGRVALIIDVPTLVRQTLLDIQKNA